MEAATDRAVKRSLFTYQQSILIGRNQALSLDSIRRYVIFVVHQDKVKNLLWPNSSSIANEKC